MGAFGATPGHVYEYVLFFGSVPSSVTTANRRSGTHTHISSAQEHTCKVLHLQIRACHELNMHSFPDPSRVSSPLNRALAADLLPARRGRRDRVGMHGSDDGDDGKKLSEHVDKVAE
jgi:hypothetical protein